VTAAGLCAGRQFVTALHRQNPRRVGLQITSARQTTWRHQRHPDPTIVGDTDEAMIEVDRACVVENSEHLGRTDLLQGQDVRLDPVDDLGECLHLLRELLVSGRPVGWPTGNRFCTFHDITVNFATPHLRAWHPM
jgi:hypothetical protein